MSKIIGLVFTITFLLLGSLEFQRAMFSKYQAVEAYEVRPGILMMPRFSTDGQLCEVGLERLHYTTDEIILSSDLNRDEIYQVFEELAPISARGARPKDLLERGGLEIQGNTLVENQEYENVSLHIYSENSSSSERQIVANDVVATITWKHRKGCFGSDIALASPTKHLFDHCGPAFQPFRTPIARAAARICSRPAIGRKVPRLLLVLRSVMTLI